MHAVTATLQLYVLVEFLQQKNYTIFGPSNYRTHAEVNTLCIT